MGRRHCMDVMAPMGRTLRGGGGGGGGSAAATPGGKVQGDGKRTF